MLGNFVIWSLTQAAVGLGFVWLFKEAIRAAMLKSAQKDLERQKHELSRLSETLKFQLQREMIKAELSTAKIHEIYPHLAELLRLAEGAVARFFGIMRSPDFKNLSNEEIDFHLEQSGFPLATRTKLIETITKDRERGLKTIDQVFSTHEIIDARRRVIDARNYTITKSLYISPTIRQHALDITTSLHNLTVDLELKIVPKEFRAQLESVSTILNEVEEKMRDELNPRLPNTNDEHESQKRLTKPSKPFDTTEDAA
jgi:hypothetical protein